MTEGAWYVDADGVPVEAEDEGNYDEAYGPSDGVHDHDGRLVEDDEGIRPDVTSESVARVAAGDHGWESAEEAAIHIIDETELDELDLVDLDALPADPDDR